MIEIVVAFSNNYAIGKDNKLLWHIPEDLKRFKEITQGHTVLMGRKTWESLPDKFRPLPNRHNIVLTRNKNYVAEGATVITSLDNIPFSKKLFVIGGAELYRETIEIADTLHITNVHAYIDEADAFFPKFNLNEWKITDTIDSNDDNYKYSFLTLKRKG